MRSCLVALSLWVPLAAQAATWSGRVLWQGAALNGARVEVFERLEKPIAGCKGSGPHNALGTCLCPGEREGFSARALAGLKSPTPVASTTTGPDGAFSLTLEGAGPFAAHVSSADGTAAVVVHSLNPTSAAMDLPLSATTKAQLRVDGVGASGAVVFTVDPLTGELAPFTLHEGLWVSPPLTTGIQELVVAAPGAVPQRQVVFQGRVNGPKLNPFEEDSGPARIVLSAPALLRGVVSERGRLVAGAEVVADPDSCALRTKTDAAGEFSLPAIVSAPWLTTLTARLGGKFASVYGSTERLAELELQPVARLELTLVDSAGAPVGGVEVGVSGTTGADRTTRKTDAQGRWNSGERMGGTVQLKVGKPYVLLGDRAVTLNGVTRLRAVVVRGASITGRVLDAKGAPAPGVTIIPSFAPAMFPKLPTAAKDALFMAIAGTDAKGAFTLEGLLPGEYELAARSGTSGEGTVHASAPGEVELRLGPVFLLEGVVVDAAGAPVAKARVSAQREGFSYSISTGADGRFSAGLRSAGTYVVTAARRNGAATQPLRVEVPGTEGLKLVVGEELVLRGSVVGPNGEARAGVLVQAISSSFPTLMIAKHVPQQQPLDPAALVPYARQTGQYLEATSTADGSFSLPMGGEALVFAQVGQELSEPVEGSPTAPVRLVLSPRARATGRVLDWNRRPVPGFSINSTRFNSAEGRFELPLPARGSVSLRIEAPLAPSETRAVEVPATPGEVPLGDILLKRGFTVVGRVLDARTHKPIGTPLTLGAKSDGGALDGTAVQGDGTFVLKRVPAGKLALNVGASGYAPKAITLEVKEGLREQLLELEKAASLELKVLRAGEPAAGVNVEVIGPDALPGQPENRRTGGTSSDGTWKREQLAAGAWTVKVGRPTSTVRTVVLRPGQQGTLELSVP